MFFFLLLTRVLCIVCCVFGSLCSVQPCTNTREKEERKSGFPLGVPGKFPGGSLDASCNICVFYCKYCLRVMQNVFRGPVLNVKSRSRTNLSRAKSYISRPRSRTHGEVKLPFPRQEYKNPVPARFGIYPESRVHIIFKSRTFSDSFSPLKKD